MYYFEKGILLLSEKSRGKLSEPPRPLIDSRIDCKKVTVNWPSTTTADNESVNGNNNTLTDVSFSVKPGKVMAIIGQVGSGKVYNYINYFNSSKFHFLIMKSEFGIERDFGRIGAYLGKL